MLKATVVAAVFWFVQFPLFIGPFVYIRTTHDVLSKRKPKPPVKPLCRPPSGK